MKLKIKKENNKIFILDEQQIIEEYDFDKPIDFSKLFKRLIEDEFNSSIENQIEEFEKTDSENELIKLIEEIIDDYNKKKQELDDFKKVQN